MATMEDHLSAYETSLWPLTTKSLPATTTQVASKEEPAGGSPESLPYLAALSQTSTDGDDHPHLEYEVPGVLANSMLSDDEMAATSWPSPDTANFPAILDTDECSSGILSAEALDLSEASFHSFASMATLKSPIGRLSSVDSEVPDPVLEPIDAEDIKINRTCHGALNIDPKQLANVFALFKNEPKTPQSNSEKQSTDPPGIRTIELAAISPAAIRSSAATIEQPALGNAHPWTGYARNQKMTAEMYWKPRAETFEKECGTLKGIISSDSSKIFQLKTALAAQSAAIESSKEQLALAKRDIEVLQKEKEIFAETETEHCETIRILKEEVDRLTRDDSCIAGESIVTADETSSFREELEQLRLENQLFASQIIEYEAELEKLTQDVEPLEKEAAPQPSDQKGTRRDLVNDVALSCLAPSNDHVTHKETNLVSTKINHTVDCSAAQVCIEQLGVVEVPAIAHQNIVGTVLGMFTLAGNGDVDDAQRDDVVVVQQPAQSSAIISSEKDSARVNPPEDDPASVEVERLHTSQIEDRDPLEKVIEETAIEVLENHDASLEIEVQLSPYPVRNREEESETKPNSYSGMCDENCGAWNVFCIFSSEPHE